MPFCTECGFEINEGDRFCTNCGTQVAAASEPARRSEAPPPEVEEVETELPAPRIEPQPQMQPATPPMSGPAPATGTRLSFGGVLIALFWFLYSSGALGMLIGSYRFETARIMNQADWISVALIIGLPIAISVLRPLLDAMLLPLNPLKSRIPVRLLIGIGLVSPFAVAWLLYDVWGLRNYPFLHYTLLFGTLASYAILRTPARGAVQ